MIFKFIKKLMGKIFPHSSLKSRTGRVVSDIVGKVLDLSDEHFPLKKTLGGDPIEVALEPGVYLLVASFCVKGFAVGDTIRGRFCDADVGPEIPVGGVFLGGTTVTGNPQLSQLSAFVEVNSPQKIQFWLACDQERGELHGGYNSTVQTGIAWAKL
jgi:hypothetical protein